MCSSTGKYKYFAGRKTCRKSCRRNGPYLKKRWQEFEDHPLVGEVRNVGLLGALELVEDKATRKHFPKDRKVGEVCRDICIEKNIVMRAIKDIRVWFHLH
ncbi:MAG: hypothetical protein Ct9H300mP28_32800 [Pseudomonadota bacterium]|nr:MAG: hypothetical protein Ct9H300mP28_32800 [Pseudomonadota bacterium]